MTPMRSDRQLDLVPDTVPDTISFPSEVPNAWGTRNMLPIAAQQAGAPGGSAWQEHTVSAAHIVGVLVLLAYWGTILLALFRKPDEPVDGL